MLASSKTLTNYEYKIQKPHKISVLAFALIGRFFLRCLFMAGFRNYFQDTSGIWNNFWSFSN
jgi:hypothetical protein